MNTFSYKDFARNEIKLALGILKRQPDNLLQQDRLCFWYMKLNEWDKAKQHAVSPKMKVIFEQNEREYLNKLS